MPLTRRMVRASGAIGKNAAVVLEAARVTATPPTFIEVNPNLIPVGSMWASRHSACMQVAAIRVFCTTASIGMPSASTRYTAATHARSMSRVAFMRIGVSTCSGVYVSPVCAW